MSSRFAIKKYTAKYAAKYIFEFVLIGAGLFFWQPWAQKSMPDNFKNSSLKPYTENLRRTHKLMPSYQVLLVNDSGLFKPVIGDTFSLSAHIESSKNASTLRYEWIVPEGVTLLPSTARTGTLQNVTSQNSVILAAQFQNQTSENVKIFLKVYNDRAENGGVYTAQYNTTAWRNLVTCQEVGHAFGLAHQDEAFDNPNLGTCMDYTNSPASNQHPNAHDYEQLTAIYSHLDSTTTLSAAPAAMSAIDFAGPGQWGRVIASYANGRPKVYELDFGGGHKVITHVFWTPDGNRGHDHGND